ncbi:hypothetical protein [Lysobacter gummosus]|uniref:hypothetical protein n=1 Tax=Lysobacter gummosus TaxID=262324 RepID=UPI003642F2A8
MLSWIMGRAPWGSAEYEPRAARGPRRDGYRVATCAGAQCRGGIDGAHPRPRRAGLEGRAPRAMAILPIRWSTNGPRKR